MNVTDVIKWYVIFVVRYLNRNNLSIIGKICTLAVYVFTEQNSPKNIDIGKAGYNDVLFMSRPANMCWHWSYKSSFKYVGDCIIPSLNVWRQSFRRLKVPRTIIIVHRIWAYRVRVIDVTIMHLWAEIWKIVSTPSENFMRNLNF